MRNQAVARDAFIDRHQRLFLCGSNDQVSLPVTKTTTLGYDRWAFINADLIGDGASSCVPPLRLLDALVNTLVAYTGLFVDQQIAADLLRTPSIF